jgi:diguanylate cyclase (GGDEF)-like protein/PAS domain S-box-containing protein
MTSAELHPKLIYVEDDPGLARVVQLRLRHRGFSVDLAHDGQQALRMMRECEYQAALVDYKLPGLDGLQLVEALVREQRLPPTIMVSGAGDLEVAVKAMKLGVSDFLVKEVDGEFSNLMFSMIERLLRVQRLAQEKSQAEDALQEVTRQQTALLNNMPDIAWLKDRASRYIAVNEAFGKACGRTPCEIAGKTDLDIWPEPLARLHCRVDQEVIASKRRHSIEELLTDEAGKERWFETIETPIFDSSGDVIGTTGIARDITARKRSEEALRQKEAHFRHLFEHSPTPLWVEDVSRVTEWLDGLADNAREELPDYLEAHADAFEEIVGRIRLVDINDAAVTTFEADDKRALVSRWRDIYGDEARRVLTEQILAIWHGESRVELEFAGRTLRGKRIDCLLRWSAPTKGGSLDLSRAIIAFTDITRHLEAERELFDEKERAQVTLHSIGDAVITTDPHGRVEYMNPVAETLTQWSLAQARGKKLARVFRIIDQHTRKPAPDPVTRCQRAGKVVALAGNTALLSRCGKEYAIQDSAAPILDRDGDLLGVVLVFNDVTEARRLAQEVSHQAAHDALTGLVNRREFETRLERALHGARTRQVAHALCYLDLDQFKVVNDTAGHAAGDQLLVQVGALLTQKVRSRDTLARIGGDEFSLILENCPLRKAHEIAQALVCAIHDFRFSWQDRTFRLGVSIGVTPITADVENTDTLLTQADVACYTAKDLGRNRVHVYEPEDSELSRRHTEIQRAAQLREALEKEWFRLYCQPIYPLAGATDNPVEYEILLRLVDAKGEILLPGNFIPAAERYGLIAAIDRWVIHAALRWYGKLAASAPRAAGIAINLSGQSLDDVSLLEFARAQLVEFAVPPERVCFEITETAAINHLGQATRFMQELKKSGCRFALDDFGTGLSSFSYLKHLPVDYLKIDGSFVRDVGKDPTNRAMLAAINEVGHIMGISTVAEWAQDDATISQLRELGVDYVQGYLLGHPVPVEQITLLTSTVSEAMHSHHWRGGAHRSKTAAGVEVAGRTP